MDDGPRVTPGWSTQFYTSFSPLSPLSLTLRVALFSFEELEALPPWFGALL